MFRLAGRFLFAWGAGLGGSAPPVNYEGPSWVMSHHVHAHRVYAPQVHAIVVEPGRRFADNPALCTFSSIEDE